MLTEQKHHTMRNATMSCLGTMWVLGVLLLCGCSRTSEFRARLMALDSVLVQHPDSVYDVMVKMEAEAHGQSQSDRMYYELLRADAQNKAYVDFTTDSVMAEVADWYDRHGTPNEQMRAHYLLGCTYRDLGDVPMELQCFLDATTKADTTSKDCDLYTLAAIYGQMADLYHGQYLPEEELKALDMCEQIAVKDKDTLSAIIAYEKRTGPYNLMQNRDSILDILFNAYEKYLNNNYRQEAARVLMPAITILMDKNDFSTAEKYMNIFERESNYRNTEGEIESWAIFYYRCKARLALHQNDILSSVFYYNNLLKHGESEAAYEGLLLVYEKLDVPDSISKYAKLYAAANDSSFIGFNSQTVEQMTAMYNYGRVQSLQKVTANELNDTQKHRFLLTLLTICLIVLLYVGYLVYTKKRKAAVERISILNMELDYNLKRLERVQIEKNIELKKYKDALLTQQLREEELEGLQRTHVKIVEEKETIITSLQKDICQLQEELSRAESGIIQDSFFESDIYKIFRKRAFVSKHVISHDEWNLMIEKFSRYFKRYNNFLCTTPKALTEEQRKVCILIRLGFKEGEIANIMDISVKKISKIKLQINEKIFNISDAKSLRRNLKDYY